MKGFTQVVRTMASLSEANPLDPLSIFAVQSEQDASHSATPAKESTSSASLRSPGGRPASYSPKPLSQSTSFSSLSNRNANFSSDGLPLLQGEVSIISLLEATVQLLSYGDLACLLFMTNYRLIFLPADSQAEALYMSIPSLPSWLQIPLACIDKFEREKRAQSAGLAFLVTCKDCRSLRFALQGRSVQGDGDVDRAFGAISAYSFPNNLRHLFAFNHKLSSSLCLSNRSRIIPNDLQGEFARQRVSMSNLWRISSANSQYTLCSTYPSLIIVPKLITDEDLVSVAAFRSGQRLPALCWHCPENGATLWRSSQPKVGKSGSCSADERLLDYIAKSQSSSGGEAAVLNIVDCRSRTSAMANYAAGAGYESQSSYPQSRISFYGMPNIHGVRETLRNLSSILLQPSTSAVNDISFSKQIEDTSWLSNLRLLLRASWETASSLSRGVPVLVHCSHGWDRTTQVCCIAQIMLDPFYRTLEGFPVLIEKEWCAFGHPFQMRCGHGQERNNGRAEDEMSPIFLQFLDCLQQIVKQCSHAFEFNGRYLLTIAEHIYSCRFSTFLFNCDHDRMLYQSQERCTDIWIYLQANRQALTNPLYKPDVGLNCRASSFSVLPELSQLMRGVSLWSEFFLRFSSALSQPPLPAYLTKVLQPPPPAAIAACEGVPNIPRANLAAYRFLQDPSDGDVNFSLSRRILTQYDSWEAVYVHERRERRRFEQLYRTSKEKIHKLNADLSTLDREMVELRLQSILEQLDDAAEALGIAEVFDADEDFRIQSERSMPLASSSFLPSLGSNGLEPVEEFIPFEAFGEVSVSTKSYYLDEPSVGVGGDEEETPVFLV